MFLYHVTTVRNLRSIRKDTFLDPSRSRGKRAWTWFVPSYKVDWAILKTQIRHRVELAKVVILEFEFAEGQVSEHAASSKYFRQVKTPMSLCQGVKTADEWSSRDSDLLDFQEWGPEKAS